MTREEAIIRAIAFVAEHVGVDADPASTRFLERAGKFPYWSVVYMPDVLDPEEDARGVTIDGPYVLRVDDATGEVSVLGRDQSAVASHVHTPGRIFSDSLPEVPAASARMPQLDRLHRCRIQPVYPAARPPVTGLEAIRPSPPRFKGPD